MSSDRTFKALSSPVRRALLDRLRRGPGTTGALCTSVAGASRHVVIKHLDVLKEAGLVRVEPRGRERWNHLNVVPLQEIHERWLSPYEALWAGRLRTLKQLAESPHPGAPMNAPTLAVVKQSIDIAAPRARVWSLLTERIDAWWTLPYRTREDALAMRLELKLGGRFWEDWGDGAGRVWATIEAIRAPELLEFSGVMIMPGALSGTVRVQLLEADGGCRVEVEQVAVGAITDETQKAWGGGWADLLSRLAALADPTGGE